MLTLQRAQGLVTFHIHTGCCRELVWLNCTYNLRKIIGTVQAQIQDLNRSFKLGVGGPISFNILKGAIAEVITHTL